MSHRVYRGFGGIYCFHLHGENVRQAKSKHVIFELMTVVTLERDAKGQVLHTSYSVVRSSYAPFAWISSVTKIHNFFCSKESSKTRQKVQAFRDTTLFKFVVKCVGPSGRTDSQRASPPVTEASWTSRLAGGTRIWRSEQ
jgi:hypothetical protein